jgi:hypothetical protein
MFLDRRSLLQSAAALLVPSTAGMSRPTRHLPELERAIERYLQTFRAYYQPYRPDAATEEAHDRADDKLEKRKEAFETARYELMGLVMEQHGMNPETENTDLAALSSDTSEFTVVVGPEIDPDCDGHPLGRDGLTLVPRTPAARSRLDAIPIHDPHDFESEAEEERLTYERNPYPTGFDPSRCPSDEPVPTEVRIYGNESSSSVIRHWTAQGAFDCHRCELCVFANRTVEELAALRDRSCSVDVPTGRVDDVLYGPTPEPREYGLTDVPGVISDSWFNVPKDYKIERLRTVVMTRAAWDHLGLAKDPTWEHEKFGRNVVTAFHNEHGPAPRILEQAQVGAESMA